MITVLVADDHPIVRSGIVGLLDTEPDFEVIAEAASGQEAVALAAELHPDVVLMDLRMPGIGGVEATRSIVRQAEGAATRPRVLVFTTYEDDDQILAAIEAGAGGYLVKAAPADELAAGVRAVAAGQTVLAPAVAAALAEAVRGGSRSLSEAGTGGASASGQPRADVHEHAVTAAATLTAREREVLALVAEGMSNPAIARQLVIGESTVKTHLLHVFEKLSVSDRTRAVTKALELGLLGK